MEEGEKSVRIINRTDGDKGPDGNKYKENVHIGLSNCPAHAEASDAEEFKGIDTDTNVKIHNYCNHLSRFLRKKNDDYGDSLQNPSGIFQKNKMDGILARLDDKLGRIKAVGINDKTEDTIEDLIGYLIHLKIMMDGEK